MFAVQNGASERAGLPPSALAAWWGLLALALALLQGGSAADGWALAGIGTLGLLAGAAILVAARLIPAPEAPALAWGAMAGLLAWATLAFASISWSLSPQLSWGDAVRVLVALAAYAGGVWAGRWLDRPAQTAAVVFCGVAGAVAAWALVLRAFAWERFARFQANPERLAQPIGYPNALAGLCALAVPGALWLATGRGRARALRGLRAAGPVRVHAAADRLARGDARAALRAGGLAAARARAAPRDRRRARRRRSCRPSRRRPGR